MYWKEDNIVASTMQNFSMTSGPPSGPKNYIFVNYIVDEHNRHKRLKVMRACESCHRRKIKCDCRHKRLKVVRACESCRHRKIKCDSATSNTWPCAACVRLKLQCVQPAGGLEGEPGDTGPDSAIKQSIESQPFVQNPTASLQQAPSYGLATPPFPATQARNFSYVANYSKPPYAITENGYYPNRQQYPGALDDQDQAGAQVFPQYQGDPDSQREERAQVDATWRAMAGKCKLQCNEGEDFALTDVLCFLQDSNWQLPIPPGEVAAPRKCICELTRNAIERLQQPDFIIRCDPVLQCELNTFTQCLRKEEER
ncbi:hypothetical protein RBB50_012440 [Rhinocladiella similis]